MEGCCATSPSALSDGEGVAARRGDDIPAEARKYSSSQSPTEEATGKGEDKVLRRIAVGMEKIKSYGR